MDKFIYETVVYCGRTKVWRVLNLNTGTVYSLDYEEKQQAIDSIEDGKERAGYIVKYIELFDLRRKL
jgi:hypothetical protein